jgi:DNA-binding Lrp family transcriptional regulator
MVLDDIDRRIVTLLQENGRLTNAALAEAVGLTATPMLARVRRLEEAGVIQRYMAIVDPAKIGKGVTSFVHVSLKSHGLPNHTKFLALVDELPEVIECHHIAGDEDFLLKVCVRDIAELERFLLDGLSTSGVVGRVKTTLVLSSRKKNGPIAPSEEPR